MMFYDPKNMNKYNGLKFRLIPKDIGFTLMRCGEGDGSYVLTDNIIDKKVQVLSYGVGSSIPFEESLNDVCEAEIFCYDKNSKVNTDNPKIKIHKENLENFDQFLTHCENLDSDKDTIKILKMDIEGCEWDFFDNADMLYIFDKFDYVCLELHGMIEEVPEGWVIEEKVKEAKTNLKLKCRVLDKINKFYDLIHIHANNHGPRYLDFPDSLEVTYAARNYFSNKKLNHKFPIEKIDKPNLPEREDYVLDWWVDYTE